MNLIRNHLNRNVICIEYKFIYIFIFMHYLKLERFLILLAPTMSEYVE